MYLVLGPAAAWGSSLQVCTSTRQSVLLYTAWWSLYCSPPTQTSFTKHSNTCLCACLYNEVGEEDTVCDNMLILFPTFGSRAYQSSIWESNSQESKVSSTSPRKLLCPNRSWCHTDTCRVRVSSWEWLITYCTTQEISLMISKFWILVTWVQRITVYWVFQPLTLRFSLKTGLMVLALMLVFLLLCRDVSGSRYVFT